MAEFLLEIGTEEIPARMLAKAVHDLKTGLENTLKEAALSFEPMDASGAPRQLVVFSSHVDLRQEDRVKTVFGPPVRIAYDADGGPTKALQGFLRKNSDLSLEQLKTVTQPKGDVVAGELLVRGKETRDVLAEAIPNILNHMHFAKNMRWGDGDVIFVRPVRRIVALLDGLVIPLSFGGVNAGAETFGHRFHGDKKIKVHSVDDFLEAKRAHHVILRHEDRVSLIRSQIEKYLKEIGGNLVPDDDLLEEVADLVETPFVVLGSFDEAFLKVPREVLITSMREHQKSFCVEDCHDALMPFFLTVASTPHDQGGLIKKGNEWVLNARLWDAKFFWESDLNKDFEDLHQRLQDLTFQREIGSFFEKAKRMASFSTVISHEIALDEPEKSTLFQAARLAKTDLMSELVFEFPELQGNVGGLLLQHAGKDQSICDAIYDHYLPMSMDGDLPRTKVGALVSMIDKLDTLVGCFSVGLIPKGAKDPYALRRAAQGIVRILTEYRLELRLSWLLGKAIVSYEGAISTPADLKEKILHFFADRVRYFLKRQGHSHDLIEAVMATDWDRVDLVPRRAAAIAAHQERDSFRSLALNLKRMKNVVSDEKDSLPPFDASTLTERAEIELWKMFDPLREKIREAFDQCQFETAMDLMIPLADPVEAYFSPGGVFVNVEDEAIRLNRKSMLNEMRETLSLVGDISHLEAR